MNFADARLKIEGARDVLATTPVTDQAVPVSWENAREADFAVADLEKAPQEAASFAELPAEAVKARNYEAWNRDFIAWLYGTQSLRLWQSPGTKEVSRPGESERDFRIRLQQISREQRDRVVARIRQKYAPKVASLQDRIRRAEEAVAREQAQAKQQQFQTAISFGTTLLGAVLGRKAISASTLGRATTAARGVSRSMKEKQDVGRAVEIVAQMQKQLADLNAEAEDEAAGILAQGDPLTESLAPVTIKPKKTNISVQLVALAWAPYWSDAQGAITPAFD